jgi:hypothetical protein
MERIGEKLAEFDVAHEWDQGSHRSLCDEVVEDQAKRHGKVVILTQKDVSCFVIQTPALEK